MCRRDEYSRRQARAGAWRARAHRPLAAAPAAALARRPALQRVGDHCRRRDRARRLRHDEPGSLAQLERALDQVGLRLEHVRLLVCTHAHSDHYGQAGPVTDRAGCELWMHPDHAHMTAGRRTPRRALRGGWRSRARGRARGAAGALHGGPPREPSGIARLVEPDRDLVAGVRFESDLGPWRWSRRPATRRRTCACGSPSAAC